MTTFNVGIDVLNLLILCTALGCGLMAGTFFAFSTFIMKALARLPAQAGIAAMQAINIVVLTPLFLTVFVGTAITGALLALSALARWQAPGAFYLLAGGLLYGVGTFLVTMLCNVPLNNTLAAVAPDDPNSTQQWASYLANWTVWNHIRGAAALAAAASFTIALCSYRVQ